MYVNFLSGDAIKEDVEIKSQIKSNKKHKNLLGLRGTPVNST
jgi:hypothetical protein